MIEPADITKYEAIPISMTDSWGVLMRKDSTLASKLFLDSIINKFNGAYQS